ncbi:tRNA1(Val) (adenine(37)-N6)-methyltransferase [Limosilactobacillus fastidiosus]|uniref:tRNA1(Val) (Adenine(37)-N6)-methyltransferase n=1 Tax=Limosilactobacillus fastidiosus TaxID=2759855 RepID=A0A7W3U0Y6_9LACO|nr:tRNA1(Val) (adenine(37)-N6)-methyltransferase [Limosilactobacillus fastidiosus]MBB1062282.1 tRNA1(Val) (adenine(37)-N6)-methyltransferase [Limosilactobacillus fastidiosus]MBB1086650.1 tRNA1(Val) (adenine(37)-N6)-methyltransferase [Limosilactobacillus fastidiosus]MCD7083359.1 tRNA1(Val) (adenine(37)-N6)-methyltransferase [Limosilactobacillus fastidiosus]MCD7086372.1 tRNA1(Val) (adenine(37)-N6)-methyltransferase [Limosilactobacillus fastidiosus]MCD7115333.1 tRNA1(Val) (adenine(37)-N6)-methylt
MDNDKLLKANERIDQLYSQDVQIIQNPNCFAFSLDAVLLADFVRPNKKRQTKIVDLCAGNGAIGLFLHQKLGGHFTEVELQQAIADMAERTVKLNHLEERYDVLNMDIKDVYEKIPKDSADIVLCNPPYFPTNEHSQKNPNQALAIARHEIKTNLMMVVEKMSGLLKMNGRGYLVHRPDRLAEILTTLTSHRLAPKRIRFIHPKPDREANIVLIEAIKDGGDGGVRVVPPLVVNQANGEYGTEVQRLLYGDKK